MWWQSLDAELDPDPHWGTVNCWIRIRNRIDNNADRIPVLLDISVVEKLWRNRFKGYRYLLNERPTVDLVFVNVFYMVKISETLVWITDLYWWAAGLTPSRLFFCASLRLSFSFLIFSYSYRERQQGISCFPFPSVIRNILVRIRILIQLRIRSLSSVTLRMQNKIFFPYFFF